MNVNPLELDLKLLAVILFQFVLVSAHASAVFVQSGELNGQGYRFFLQNKCLVITAAHVIKIKGAETFVIDADGRFKNAEVVSVDEVLDLALLNIPTSGNSSKSKFECGVFQGSYDTARKFNNKSIGRAIWLDRIATTAGGFDRVVLGKVEQTDQNRLKVYNYNNDMLLNKGDSGSAVWFEEDSLKLMQSWLFNKNGQPNTRRTFGYLVGILIGIKDNTSILTPAEEVRTFILNALSPVDFDTVELNFGDGVVYKQKRGRDNVQYNNFLHQDHLDRLTFEIDLGNTDTRVSGVEIRYSNLLKPNAREIRGRLVADIALSSYRPGSAQAQYDKAECKEINYRLPTYNQMIRIGNEHVLQCTIENPRIARGLRITTTLAPNYLNSLSLIE